IWMGPELIVGSVSGNPANLTVFNGELYFQGNYVFNGSSELWKLTSAGTLVPFDINPGSAAGFPQNLKVFNGELYFSANNGVTGAELWKVTSAGSVVQVADINPGANGSIPSITSNGFTEFNGELYFSATTSASGSELWKLTSAGAVVQVADIKAGTPGSNPQSLTVFNGAMYFTAADATHGDELWKLTSGGSLVLMEINP